jgi:hypothetical protein
VGSAAKRKQAEEEYYLSVIGFQKQYNQLLNDQLRNRDSLNENVFTFDYINELQSGLDALSNAGDRYQEALSQLSEGEAKLGQRNAIGLDSILGGIGSGAGLGAAIGSIVPVIGTAIGAVIGGVIGGIAGIFAGKKKKDIFGDLLSEYPELIREAVDGQKTFNTELAQTLIDQSLVSGKTKLLLEDTIKWTEQLKQAREQIKSVISDLAGDLGSNLRDVLVASFENGSDAAKKMGETVSDVLQNILEQLIFDQIFSKQFKKLEDEMAKSFDIGGDNTWIDDFSRFFNESKNLTEDFNSALAAAQQAGRDFGFEDLFQAEKRPGLAGGVSTITEDTANILAGTINSIRIDVANGIAVAQQSSVYLSMIVQNTSYNKYLESIDNRMKSVESSLSSFEASGLG